MRTRRLTMREGLTPEEKLRVSVAVLLDGVDQMSVASLLGVNVGRINEAVQIARKAFEFPYKNGGVLEPPHHEDEPLKLEGPTQ